MLCFWCLLVFTWCFLVCLAQGSEKSIRDDLEIARNDLALRCVMCWAIGIESPKGGFCFFTLPGSGWCGETCAGMKGSQWVHAYRHVLQHKKTRDKYTDRHTIHKIYTFLSSNASHVHKQNLMSRTIAIKVFLSLVLSTLTTSCIGTWNSRWHSNFTVSKFVFLICFLPTFYLYDSLLPHLHCLSGNPFLLPEVILWHSRLLEMTNFN